MVELIANKKTLIFLHIPKAGGTSLRRVIEKQYPIGSRYRIYEDTYGPLQKLRNLPLVKKGKIRCISGHFPFGIDKELVQPCEYITMLRNPVDRVVAQYFYVRTHPRNYLYNIVKSKNMSLREFVSSDVSAELDNGQVRFLSGVISEKLLSDYTPVNDKIFSNALHNINMKFTVAGLTETFDESLLLMKYKLGWENVYYSRRNITKKNSQRDAISPDIIRIIERNNEYDLKLYAFVKKKQEEEIMLIGDKFEKEVSEFRKKNEQNSRYYRQLDNIMYTCERIYNVLKRKN